MNTSDHTTLAVGAKVAFTLVIFCQNTSIGTVLSLATLGDVTQKITLTVLCHPMCQDMYITVMSATCLCYILFCKNTLLKSLTTYVSEFRIIFV
jgi:hypothetical protein